MELPTPPDVIRAAYAELVVTDLAESRRFWVDLLGFVVSADTGAALYLRGYDELIHHNLILRQGGEAAAARLAFRVRAAADLDRAETFYAALGSRTTRVRAGLTPGVGEAVRAEDPLGFTVEFFAAADGAERLQQRYDLRRGAEPARIDHFNLVVPDVRAAYEYYTSLGFGLSETIEDEQTLYAAWMFRKQTVHDVAFTGGDGPRLHHLGFFAHEMHHVLRICDILGSLHEEFLIERGPGRHGVSNAFYVYLRDPDGHRVEIYTSDYYTGDPGHPALRWSVRDPRRRDFWGHPVVPSWYTEASAVLDLDGRPRPLVPENQPAEVQVGADGFTRLPVQPLDPELAGGLAGPEHLLVELADGGLRDLGHERQFSGTCGPRTSISPSLTPSLGSSPPSGPTDPHLDPVQDPARPHPPVHVFRRARLDARGWQGQPADRAHLGHAPALDDPQPVALLQPLEQDPGRGRAARVADPQRGQVDLVVLAVVEDGAPDRRHPGGDRGPLGGDEGGQVLRLQERARHLQRGAGQERGVRHAPGVGLEHRHDGHRPVGLGDALDRGGHHRHRVQVGGAVRVHHALGVPSRCRDTPGRRAA